MEESKVQLKDTVSESVEYSGEDRLSLIRLQRTGAYERFSPNLRETIKTWILNGWAEGLTVANKKPLLPRLPDGNLELDQTIVMKSPVLHTASSMSAPIQTSDLKEVDKEGNALQKIQHRLRRMVAQEAPWSQIRLICEQWIEIEPTAQTASKIVELASLHAAQDDWLETTKKYLGLYPDAYALIHHDLRESLILLLWQLDERELVRESVFNSKGSRQIVDELSVEKLSVLLFFVTQQEQEKALLFFKNNEHACLAAIRKYSKYFHVTEDSLRIHLAKFAADQNLQHEFRRLAGGVSKESEGYSSEDELVYFKSQSEVGNSQQVSSILQKIALQKNWQDRLTSLQKIANHVCRADRNKVNQNYLAALEYVSQDPMTYVPDIPDTLGEYTKFLWEYRSISVLVPSWFNLLDQFAPVWSDEVLEHSVWAFAEDEEVDCKTNVESYWFAMASLHLSAVHLKRNSKTAYWEKRLWQAHDLYDVVQNSRNIPVKYLWDELIESLQDAIFSTFDLDPKRRSSLIFMLEIFKANSSSSVLDLKSNSADLESLRSILQSRSWERLIEFYRINQSYKNLEILLHAHFRLFSIANFSLALLWEISALAFNYDRCWRVASILSSREALSKSVEVSWQVSGERRSFYATNPVRDADIQNILSALSTKEYRLFHALFKLSLSMADLFKIVGVAESTQLKEGLLTFSAFNFFTKEVVEDPLQTCKMLQGSKQYETMRAVGHLSAAALPTWIEVYPSNPWTELLFKIAQRNGFFIWEWKLSQLRMMIHDVVAGISKRANSSSYSSRVAHWLKSLDAEQRSSWSELPVLCKDYGDEESFKLLFLFLAKVTTLIYPSHFQALESMRAMRIPLDIIRDFEHWLLSEEYEIFRNKFGQKTNIPIPKNYEKAEKILK